MLSYIMNLKVRIGSEQEAIRLLSTIDREANTHEGCILFSWFQHLHDPLAFSMVECWTNQDCLDRHIAQIIDIWNEFTPCLDGEAVSTELKKLIDDQKKEI